MNMVPTPFTPTVSVIVPVYNGARTLSPCLDSLLALNYPPEKLEIIVVDNASTDGTAAVLAGYGDAIRVFREPVRGAGAARNHGLRRALHDVIAFTDADCVVDKNWLRHLIEPLHDPSVGIVGGKNLAVRPCSGIEEFGERIHDHAAVINQRIPTAATMNWASRRTVLQEANGFDERFLRGQDTDLSFRIFLAGYRLVYAPSAIIYHHNRSTLWGLFREGCQHGYGSVRWCRKHAAALRRLGRGRVSRNSYRVLGEYFKASIRGDDRLLARCLLFFNIGKKIGKLIGSIRFGHVEL